MHFPTSVLSAWRISGYDRGGGRYTPFGRSSPYPSTAAAFSPSWIYRILHGYCSSLLPGLYVWLRTGCYATAFRPPSLPVLGRFLTLDGSRIVHSCGTLTRCLATVL